MSSEASPSSRPQRRDGPSTSRTHLGASSQPSTLGASAPPRSRVRPTQSDLSIEQIQNLRDTRECTPAPSRTIPPPHFDSEGEDEDFPARLTEPGFNGRMKFTKVTKTTYKSPTKVQSISKQRKYQAKTSPPVGVDIIEISDSESDEEPRPRKRKRTPKKREDAPRKRPRIRSVSVISINDNSTGNEAVASATFEDITMTDDTVDNVDIDGMAHMGLDDLLAPEQDDLISNEPPPEPILPSSLLSPPSPVWTESQVEDARYFDACLASVARESDKSPISGSSPRAEEAPLSLPIAPAAPSAFVSAVPPTRTPGPQSIPPSPSPFSPHITQPTSASPPPQWRTSTRFLAPPPPHHIPSLATRLGGQFTDGHLPGKPFYKKYAARRNVPLSESVSAPEPEQNEVQVAVSDRDALMPFRDSNPNPNSAQPPTTGRPVPKINPCNGYSPPPVSPRSDSTLGTPPSAISVVLPVSVPDPGPSFVKHVEIVISSHLHSNSTSRAALPISFNASPLKHVATASDTEFIDDDDDLELLYPPSPQPDVPNCPHFPDLPPLESNPDYLDGRNSAISNIPL
ncbi:hypothetical protein R3P38DRAFT_3357929 [Favolaschia claudopus]|uniref:Uncharacterized protein n=1 Tax=Favolaschia claudopus TaxID=2862362 RepID=A0AAW0B6C8_9AGAR